MLVELIWPVLFIGEYWFVLDEILAWATVVTLPILGVLFLCDITSDIRHPFL